MTGISLTQIKYVIIIVLSFFVASMVPVNAVTTAECFADIAQANALGITTSLTPEFCESLTEESSVSGSGASSATDNLGDSTFPNPLGKKFTSVEDVIANVIKATLGIVGVVALLMFVYGGIVWMTAAGNQERVKTGREVLRWATIGIVIIFTSYALVIVILSAFQGG